MGTLQLAAANGGSRLAARVRRATGRLPPSRSVAIEPDDTFLVSFPRSGNTWMRFIIANLIRPQDRHTFESVSRVVPDIYRMSSRDLRRAPRPRILKSHEPFDARYPKVIYVVRDPRDVAVSYFHYQARETVRPADHSLARWVEGFVSGAVSPYGTWADHVDGWISQRQGSPSFLVLRYEDLSLAPLTEVEKLARFIGIDDPDVANAVEQSSVSRLRTNPSLAEASVRRGTVGSWRDELSGAAADRIESAFGPLMAKLGYLP